MINPSIPQSADQLKPRITVIGVGGAGGNAVSNMIRANLEGVEFLIANTDAQAMQQALASRKIQLGASITRGLGAGARADVGRAAAEEALSDIMAAIDGSNMVFITAGMGGGTGTGAAPVIARAAREHGILTVGVVTKPFHFEGSLRMRQAEAGIESMQEHVDTLIVIPNQNLFRVANESTTFADAFNMADQVLHSGVRGVTDLMVMPGLINLDFNDIRSVMSEMGKAMMGTGEGEGSRRAVEAAEAAISNPLLDDVSMKGARGVLINVTGGTDMTLFEVDEAANRIRDEVDPDANIIFGSTFDQSMNGKMRVSVVATGIDAEVARRTVPDTVRLVSPAAKPALFSAANAPARTSSTSTPAVASATSASNNNAAAPAAATASATLRPLAQSASQTFAQTSSTPISGLRTSQPAGSAQNTLRVTGTSNSANGATTASAGSAMGSSSAATYGNAALQMMPAVSSAPPTPSPTLTVVPRETQTQAQTVEPNFAQLYETSAETTTSAVTAPWWDATEVAAAAPAAMSATSAFLFSEEEAPRLDAPATPKKKGPSLFERVTGLATGRKAGETSATATSPEPSATASQRSQLPGFMGLNLTGGTSAAATAAPEPQLLNQQPAKLSQADEDLLEIPAFLRRQAN